MITNGPFVSVVVPAFNEEENIVRCIRSVTEALQKATYRHEIIVVNDGSTDDTLRRAKSLQGNSLPVRTIDLRHNYGKARALWEGTRRAKGDLIAFFDADLQYDPADMLRMIHASHGFDMVSGRRDYQAYGLTRTILSRLYNGILRLMFRVSIDDSNCGIKVMTRRIVEEGNPFRYGLPLMVPLLKVKGFRVGEVSVSLRARAAGRSKFFDDGAFLGGKRNFADLSYHSAMLLGLLANLPLEWRRGRIGRKTLVSN